MPISRSLTVKYGKLTVGGNTDNKLHGNIVRSNTPYGATISFTFIIAGTSQQDIAGKIRHVEDQLRVPEQDFSIRYGNNTELELKGNNQSGSGARPIFSRPDDIKWTGLARRYDVTITYDRQADKNPDTDRWPQGLIDSTDSVVYTGSGLAIITIEGTFSSLAGKPSSQVFDEKSDKMFDAIKASYAGRYFNSLPSTHELNSNISDDRTTFSYVFKELIYDQGPVVTHHNDPEVINDKLVFMTNAENPGNDKRALRFTEVMVSYSAEIDTTNTDLKTKLATLKEWLIGRIATLTGIQISSLLKYSPTMDVVENTIGIEMTLLGFPGVQTGSAPIILTVSTEKKVDEGKVLIPVWDGNPMSRYLSQGPRTEIWTCIVQGRFAGTLSNGDEYLNPPGATNVRISYSNKSIPQKMGTGNQTALVSDVLTTASWQVYAPAAIVSITPSTPPTAPVTPSGGAFGEIAVQGRIPGAPVR